MPKSWFPLPSHLRHRCSASRTSPFPPHATLIIVQSLIAHPCLLPIYPLLLLALSPYNPNNFSYAPSKYLPNMPLKQITQTSSTPMWGITPCAHIVITTNDLPSSTPFKNVMGFGMFTQRSLDSETSLISYPLKMELAVSAHLSTTPNFSCPLPPQNDPPDR